MEHLGKTFNFCLFLLEFGKHWMGEIIQLKLSETKSNVFKWEMHFTNSNYDLI